MGAQFRLTVQQNRLPVLGAETRKRLSAVVRKTAFDVEAHAKANAPVDTGALRNSIQAEVVNDLNAEVGVGMDYGALVEFGTTRAPAQPYLGPAVETVRPAFERAVARAVEDAAK